jgi:ABC-type ATPase involved in cell division
MIIIKDVVIFNSCSEVILAINSLLIENQKIFLLHSETELKKKIFLETIAKKHHCFAGHILIDETIIERYTEKQFAKKIQFSDNKGTLFNTISLYNQFFYVLREHNLTAEDIQERIYKEFEKIEKTHLLSLTPYQLTYSEKVIMSICLKIIVRPKYILLNCPSESLEKEEKIILFYYLLNFYKEGGTLIINTSDPYLKNFFTQKELLYL